MNTIPIKRTATSKVVAIHADIELTTTDQG